MSAVKLLPYYTYDDYCHWEGRWELIDGIPFAMSPAPSLHHQWLAGKIITELSNSIKKSKCKHCKVYDFIDIKIEEDTILQPDCTVICKPTKRSFLDFPAALVVEILSPSTALKDLHTKFSIYEKFGIKYYMIVDEEKNEIEIYCLKKLKYVLQKSSLDIPFTFSVDDDCEIEVLLQNIWE